MSRTRILFKEHREPNRVDDSNRNTKERRIENIKHKRTLRFLLFLFSRCISFRTSLSLLPSLIGYKRRRVPLVYDPFISFWRGFEQDFFQDTHTFQIVCIEGVSKHRGNLNRSLGFIPQMFYYSILH